MQDKTQRSKRIPKRLIFGAIVLLIGVMFMLRSLDVTLIDELWQWWPSIIILTGIVMLIANRFRNRFVPTLLILIGAFVQIQVLDIDTGIEISRFFWPVILIIAGTLILAGGLSARRRKKKQPTQPHHFATTQSDSTTQDKVEEVEVIDDDNLNTSAVWSSVHKRINSTDFKGGSVTAVMGSLKLDMRETIALQNHTPLEITCVMGEVKLRVPPEWDVTIDNNTTNKGKIDDKRKQHHVAGPSVGITITGTVVMGSLQIED